MILVDTAIWIDHFRRGNPHLVELLLANRVGVHPWIVGELACGNLSAGQIPAATARGQRGRDDVFP
jgi:predicted nucleic acid-binding protein